jgi:type IV pilus assembly protein PilM
MNMNKEIKLGDLFKNAKKKSKKASGGVKRLNDNKPKKKQDVVGLKIGASQLAAAHIVNNGTAKLVEVAREPLEPGIVVAGEVRDMSRLADALDGFFSRNKLPRKNVRLGIGTNRVGVRVLDVTDVEDEDQLANAVTFRAHETMAIPMDQAVLDFHVVGQPDPENGNAYRVVLAAAYREPIDQLVMACQAAHLELMGIDVEAFALLRAVGSRHTMFQDAGPTAVVAVALGHDRSILAISDGTVCDFTRVLDWGGAKIDAAITRGVGVTGEEAAELKLNVSLDPDDDEPGDATMARAREAVRNELSNLARELIASLQFYQSQPESLAIGEILVTGGTSKMPGLVDELAKLVRARVAVADPLAAVEVPEGTGLASREDLPSLAVAIGLGVGA